MSVPFTRKTTVSAMFVAWSATRLEVLGDRLDAGRAVDGGRLPRHQVEHAAENLRVVVVNHRVPAEQGLGLVDVPRDERVEGVVNQRNRLIRARLVRSATGSA